MNNSLKYTIIDHNFRKLNNLSLTEYCLCDMIYHLSKNKNNIHNGWCFMNKENQAVNLGVSRQTISTLEKKMIDSGFLEKDETTSWTRTTKKWDEVYLSKEEKPALHDVKKLYTPCKETLHPSYIYNNNNNNIYTSGEEKKEKTIQYTPEDLTVEEKEKNCVQKEKENKADLEGLKQEDDKLYQKEIISDKTEEKEVKTKLCNPFDFDKIFKYYNRGNYETAYRLYHKSLNDIEKEKMYKHVYEYIELTPLEFRVNIEKYIKTKMFNDSLDHLKKSKKEEVKEKELILGSNKPNIKTDLDEVWEMYEELEKKKQNK